MAPFESFRERAIKISDEEEVKVSERALEEREKLTGHHSEDLYDQNEDAAGEKINLATGLPFVNDNETPELVPTVVERGTRDALPDLEEEDDAAAKWLRENGG